MVKTKEIKLDHFLPGSEKSLHSLIEIGTNGHFPLFENNWFNEITITPRIKLSKKHLKIARDIIKRLSRHKALDRKKLILSTLNKSEREVFMQLFFSIVEDQIQRNVKEFH